MHKIAIINSIIFFFILLNKNWILYFIKLHEIRKILFVKYIRIL